VGFHSLQHSRIRRSTDRGFCRPATFRPQGLVTLATVFSLRIPAGFVSRRRRSWDSPFGAFASRKVSRVYSTRMDPPTLQPQGASAAEATNRLMWHGFLGFDPSESPSRSGLWLTCPPPVAPLGFALPRPAGENRAADFAATPLSCLAGAPPKGSTRPHLRVSLSPHLARPAALHEAAQRAEQPS